MNHNYRYRIITTVVAAYSVVICWQNSASSFVVGVVVQCQDKDLKYSCAYPDSTVAWLLWI